jgi:predicted dithiol-disulfide oxidoreductase (DUF899 family)
MTSHTVGTRAQWDAARADLLEREKQHTRLGDDLARRRRELPWIAVEKPYTLQTADGPKPLAALQLLGYRERMGWDLNWASSYGSDFDLELGFSSTEERTRAWVESAQSAALPPIAHRNARASGTDLVGYLTQGYGFNAFALEDKTVYRTYATAGRGVEFLMTYYGILDHAPRGRDESEGFQLWIQRGDEYDREQ